MAQDINDAVTYLQKTIVDGIAGMRKAPTEIPEQMNVFPFAVSYVSGLSESRQPSKGYQINLWAITTEIHVARKDLPRDYEGLKAFNTLFPAAVWGDYNANGAALGGYVDTINGISGGLQPSTWGGTETLAWTFTTTVKVKSAWET